MKAWYVVAIDTDTEESTSYINVFGPFFSETDARAYALDLAQDNGWAHVEPREMTFEEADALATDNILWPYDQGGEAK